MMRTSTLLDTFGFLLLVNSIAAPSSLPLMAQSIVRSVPEGLEANYIVDTWQTEDGLPQSSVNAICQTRDGYLWLATYDGLVRFNGVEFTVFTMSNTPELKSNRVIALFEDSKGYLWAGMERGGLVRYKDGTFTSYSTEAGLESDVVLAIAETPDGTLWVGTGNAGLHRWNDGRFEKVFTAKGEWMSDVCGALLSDSQGTLWIGTGNGLYLMKNEKIEQVRDIPPVPLTAFLEDAHHTIWIGTGFGVYRLEKGAWTKFAEHDGIPDTRALCLFSDREGIIWLGTMGGICQFKGGQWISYKLANGISQNNIETIFEDREKNIWIGTNGAGLIRLKKRMMRVYTMKDGLSHDVILAIFQDRAGTMWIGTNCGGLNRFRNGVFTNYSARYGLPNDCVWSIWEDRKGNIWTGTWGGGISTYANGKLTRFTETQGLSNNAVLAIYEDRAGTLWAGTGDGLNRLRDGSVTVYKTKDGLSHNDIRAICEDSSGALWIGTYGGLTRYQNGQFTVYNSKDGLSNNFVRALYPDQDGTLWIGTYGGGLNRFKHGKFVSYTSKVGLFDDGVFQILEDKFGNFWMSCNKGIFRVAKKELNEFAEGKRSTLTSIAYGKADGMENKECNGGFQPAGWKAYDGKLWFPTVKGMVVIDPERVFTNTIPPPVVVEKFVKDGVTIPLSQTVVLDPGTNHLEFHYAGLSYSGPERVMFRYTLEGYDQTWIEAGTRRVAYYTNLPPGTYVFKVTAANENGVWNEAGTSLHLELRPFFYQTRLFYALSAIALVVVSVGFYFLRVQRLVRRNLQLERHVSERTQELNALLERLEEKSKQLEIAKLKAEEANHAKSQFLAIVSHELRTPLNSVIGFTNILIKRKQHDLDEEDMLFLERILENGKHLLSIIEDVLDLSKIEAGRIELNITRVPVKDLIRETIAQLEGRILGKDLTIQAEVPDDVVPLETDAGKLKQVLINLIGNAIKFTEQGSIRVRVKAESTTHQAVRIDVIDSGIGIPPDRQTAIFEPFKQADSSTTRRFGGTGLGLTISRTFSELLGYRLELHSEVGKGSTFSIILDKNQPTSEH